MADERRLRDVGSMRPIRVLLVDDSPEFRDAAAAFLARDPRVLVVGQAGDGQEGLRLVQELVPDLVLMDLAMPVLNGLVATRRIKALEGAPSVIIASLHDGPEYRSSSREAGADGFLSKSELIEGLPVILETWLLGQAKPAGSGRAPLRAGRDTVPTPLKVLLLQDPAADPGFLVDQLEQTGFAPQWRRAGTEADYLEALDPGLDIILADYHLPGWEAMKALAILQARGWDIPFIVVSGVADEHIPVEAMRAGACDYLQKDRLSRLGPVVVRELREAQERRERRRAEQDLWESHERFELANRATFNVIWDWDLRTGLVWRNDNFQALFGYRPEELGADFEFTRQHIHPEDREPVDASLQAAMGAGAEFWEGRYRFRRKDGSYASVEDRGCIVRDLDGRPIRMLGAMQDVSERQGTEDALRESEHRYRTLFLAHPCPMWVYDQETLRFLAVNDAAVGHYGYSRDEFLARSIEDIRPSEDLEKLHRNLIGTTGDGLQASGHWRHRKQDGGLIDVEITSHGLRFGDRPARVVLAQDITARLQTEARLRLQSSALEAGPMPSSSPAARGLIEWANDAFTRLSGYSPAEAIGTRPGDLVNSGLQDQAFYDAMWTTILAGQVWRGELINRRKDGATYTEDMTITPVKDAGGATTHFIAVKQDISDRVESERKLRAYAERLEAMRKIDAAILDAAPLEETTRRALAKLRRLVPFERAGVILLDPALNEGTLYAVDQDQPWQPLEGATRQVGSFHNFAEWMASPYLDLPDLDAIQRNPVEELLHAQGLRNLVYVPMKNGDSVLGYLALASTLPHALDIGGAETAQDIAKQLAVAFQHARMREELKLSQLRLESEVEQRTAELRTTVASLKELEGELRRREADAQAASEAKSVFLSSMSHELRTPLIGVTGMLEILAHTGLDAEQRRIATIIQQSSESLLQIIGDILDFSKIEANKLELAPQTFSAQALLESVAQTFRPVISAKGLNFTVDVDPGLAPAHVADVLRIRQVLNNFLSNAVKFTEQGSIALRLRLRHSSGSRESLAFEVEDTGIGVSPADQAKLFAPFAQADASTARRFGGTGLGLAISRRLAELMGGGLAMRSHVGRGTTLTLAVDLPTGSPADLAKADAPDPWKAVPRRPAPSAGVAEAERSLILLAEDHPTNRIVLSQQVHRAGYSLEVAVDGREAFEKWQSGRFALLLTDLQMPHLDGYQLTKAVRDWERLHGLARTPILVLTANALSGEAERCLEQGMDDYLIKPVTIPQLASKLQRWLPHLHEKGPG